MIKNYTPHTINEVSSSSSFPPFGEVARVKVSSVERTNVGGIPIYSTFYGAVEGLPQPEKGVFLLVSAMVRLALPKRADLISPGQLVRDDSGNPIGCQGFNGN